MSDASVVSMVTGSLVLAGICLLFAAMLAVMTIRDYRRRVRVNRDRLRVEAAIAKAVAERDPGRAA